MRIFFILAPFLIFTFLFSSLIYAQATTDTSSTSSATVNSFELFWPISAGRTEGDFLYSLKLLREKIGWWFTYGDTKKADYAVLLGTKRVLEAEKLLKDNKVDLVLKTLDRADFELSSAYVYVEKADKEGKLSAGKIRRDRLIYVKRLIDYLKTTSPSDTFQKLDTVKEKADAPLRDYLP